LRIDYKLDDKFDFGLFIPVMLLITIGLMAIYSSTFNHPVASGNFEKQMIWAIVAVLIFFIAFSLPTNSFRYAASPVYFLSVILLIAVLVMGRKVSGAQSWFHLGPVGFQPSEIAKIGTILALAAFLSRRNADIDSFLDIIFALVIGFVPVGLILLEPDLGTSIVFIGMILTLIFWKGISLFSLFVVLSPGFVAVAALFGFYYFISAMVLIVITLFLFKKDIFIDPSI